ncbi:hypothetical protein AB2N04_18880 [Nitratireductor sp. GISD-1A_MAKvit]|uniref:hypothetical protein n=1 Tax=Nitratireductor sp. GISD-1A_MAKvit TaxID=3234198 RepID=UPI003467C9B8
MDAIEKAIRKAFAKGDASKRPFREKVYRSAFAALERTLEARDDLSDNVKLARREALKKTITEIETEFVPAAPSPQRAGTEAAVPPVQRPERRRREPPSPSVEPQRPRAPEAQPERNDFAPRIDPNDRGFAGAAAQDDGVKRRIRENERRPRRPYAMLFLVATVVAFVGLGVWWTLSSGILLSGSQRDTSVRNPPLAFEEEDYSAGDEALSGAGGGSRAVGDWITVFDPNDPTTVSTPDGGQVDVIRNDNRAFLRASTSTARSGIAFDVGQGILERLSGRNAIFSIEVRSQDGEETQLSLSCRFGALGGCGRTRYVVGPTRSDYLFEVKFPDISPNGGGTITLVPDATGGGRAIDVFSIRAAVATQ